MKDIKELTDSEVQMNLLITATSIDKTLKWIKGFCIFLVIVIILGAFIANMQVTGSKF